MLSKCRHYTPEPRFQTKNGETWIRAIVRSIRQNIRTVVLTFGQNEIRSVQKLRSKYFHNRTNNWVISATMNLSKNFQKVVTKFQETYEIPFKVYFCGNHTKSPLSQQFHKFSVRSR